jgi:hypothetical protein
VAAADELVSDFLTTDFDRVARDGLSVEEKVQKGTTGSDIPYIAVSNEYNEVCPIKYDARHLRAASTDSAIRDARGGSDDE